MSKAALNPLTDQFANEHRHGESVTRSTGRSADDASNLIVELATLGPDGPTGGFFDDDDSVPW